MAATLNSPRIVIVDDSKLILRLARRALERAGYRVDTVGDATALQTVLAEYGVPDLLLVDVTMPDQAGDDLVRALRRGPTRDVPIVLFSDIDEAELAARAGAAGASGYVSKHWGLDRLVAEVGRMLAPAPPNDDTSNYSSESGATTRRRTLADREEDGDTNGVVVASTSSVSSRAPRVPEPGDEESAITATQPSARPIGGTARAQGALVLVIDDSNLIGKLVGGALRNVGHRVVVCETFDDVQQALDTHGPPDLILVDVHMPDVLGDDLVVYLRRRLAMSSPIVMFSNVAERELEFRAKEAGADGFIAKRWGVARMVEEVQAYLRRRLDAGSSTEVG